MCAADLVVFEAGSADFQLFTKGGKAAGSGKRRRLARQGSEAAVVAACEARPAAECDAALAASAGGDGSGRLGPIEPFLGRLRQLLQLWRTCRQRRGKSWRAVYKLLAAPPPRARPDGARDCSWMEGGYAAEAHHVQQINEATRAEVEALGFETFDAFGATLHARPQWFDGGERLRQVSGPVEPTASARRVGGVAWLAARRRAQPAGTRGASASWPPSPRRPRRPFAAPLCCI